MAYSAVIKHYRKLRGMSQHDLAVAVGITSGAVTGWERAKNPPTHKHAVAVDDALKADGAILDALGYKREISSSDDELAVLRGQVRRLRQAVLMLGDRVGLDVVHVLGPDLPRAVGEQ